MFCLAPSSRRLNMFPFAHHPAISPSPPVEAWFFPFIPFVLLFYLRFLLFGTGSLASRWFWNGSIGSRGKRKQKTAKKAKNMFLFFSSLPLLPSVQKNLCALCISVVILTLLSVFEDVRNLTGLRVEDHAQ